MVLRNRIATLDARNKRRVASALDELARRIGFRLAPGFSEQIFKLDGIAFGINYGLNKVRFPAPLPVGGKVRMKAKVASVESIQGGAQVTLELTFEHEGGEKPVCVAETLARLYEGGD